MSDEYLLMHAFPADAVPYNDYSCAIDPLLANMWHAQGYAVAQLSAYNPYDAAAPLGYPVATPVPAAVPVSPDTSSDATRVSSFPPVFFSDAELALIFPPQPQFSAAPPAPSAVASSSSQPKPKSKGKGKLRAAELPPDLHEKLKDANRRQQAQHRQREKAKIAGLEQAVEERDRAIEERDRRIEEMAREISFLKGRLTERSAGSA